MNPLTNRSNRQSAQEANALASFLERLRSLRTLDEGTVPSVVGLALRPLGHSVDTLRFGTPLQGGILDSIQLERPRHAEARRTLLLVEIGPGGSLDHSALARIWGFGEIVQVERREPPNGVVTYRLCAEGRDELFATYHLGHRGRLRRLVLKRAPLGAI